MIKRTTLSLLTLLLAVVFHAHAHIQVSGLFSDNMVLQQGVSVPIWGYAHEGDKVTVTFRGQKVSATAHNLKWSLKLHALKAGGPDTLTIATETHKLQFTNVMVGEVWICSGQSNMEWPLSSAFEPANDIASATNTLIRIFKVPNVKSDAPSVKANAAWEVCSPQSVPNFSAVGYYFGRDLQKARKVPVGLIQSDWGGSPAEAWMSREALEMNAR